MLTDSQKQRYLRNTILDEISEDGQEKLLNSKILVIGAGGLGSPVILYLAAAGVGNIGIVEDDIVEMSNLQRQIIHNEKDLGVEKAYSAKRKVVDLNQDVNVEAFNIRATKENLLKMSVNYDLVIDATDNFFSRSIINEACFVNKKPFVFSAVKGFVGQLSVFKPFENSNPCYVCFNQNTYDKSHNLPLKEKGILGPVAGAIGSVVAISAIKEILNIGESLVGKILLFDFLENNFRKIKLSRNKNCKVCSN